MTTKLNTANPETMSLDALAVEALALKIKLGAPADRLDELLTEIKKRAKDASPDGETWTHPILEGHEIVVTFAAPSRKWINDPAALKKLCADKFAALFTRQVGYEGIKDLVTKAKELLPKTHAAKVLELATKPGSVSAKFQLTKKGNS